MRLPVRVLVLLAAVTAVLLGIPATASARHLEVEHEFEHTKNLHLLGYSPQPPRAGPATASGCRWGSRACTSSTSATSPTRCWSAGGDRVRLPHRHSCPGPGQQPADHLQQRLQRLDWIDVIEVPLANPAGARLLRTEPLAGPVTPGVAPGCHDMGVIQGTVTLAAYASADATNVFDIGANRFPGGSLEDPAFCTPSASRAWATSPRARGAGTRPRSPGTAG